MCGCPLWGIEIGQKITDKSIARADAAVTTIYGCGPLISPDVCRSASASHGGVLPARALLQAV